MLDGCYVIPVEYVTSDTWPWQVDDHAYLSLCRYTLMFLHLIHCNCSELSWIRMKGVTGERSIVLSLCGSTGSVQQDRVTITSTSKASNTIVTGDAAVYCCGC
jgi:hypothetical protein